MCTKLFSWTPHVIGRICETSSDNFCTPCPISEPRSNSVNISTPSFETSILVAIIEGRGNAKGEVGLAAYDLRNPVLQLYQFTDSQTYAKLITMLNILNPLEVILPNTICEMGNSSRLFQLISENCFTMKVTSVNRKYFNDQKGIQCITKLCLPGESAIGLEVNTKYYCLAATNALLRYIEFIQNIDFAPMSLKIVFKENDDSTMLDFNTVKKLELIKNAIFPKSFRSLYGILNNTKTHMGARLLRCNILQPLNDLNTIKDRLDLVEEFLENSNLYHKVRYAIGKFPDVEHLLSLLVHIPKIETLKTAENKVSILILLKDTLESVDALKDAFHCSKSDILRSFHDVLDNDKLTSMLQKILSIIDNNAHHTKGAFSARVQIGFAVKPEINGLLDISRRTYSEAVDDVNQLVNELSEKYNFTLKSGYSASRGFYLHMIANGRKINELPQEFLKPIKNKHSIIFTTYEMMSLNERIKDSLNEIFLLSGKVAEVVIHEIRNEMSCLYKLSECVAILDMMSCFAFNCINSPSNQVRPEFTTALVIKNSHHPILGKTCPGISVPNNVFASSSSNFTLIGGPNMSGKSTYLSQVVLLQIMAQIGSFIPAEAACFRIAGRIFTRIGNDLDIGIDISNFMFEMKEMNYILQNVNCSSLVVIDELGRGTSAEESLALCQSLGECLLETKAFTFFATHCTRLMSMSELYPNVENYYFNVHPVMPHSCDDGDDNHVDYSHVLVKGKMKHFHYGIHLASISTLPTSLSIEASHVGAYIEKLKQRYFDLSEESRRLFVFKLYRRLEVIFNNSCSMDEMRRNLIDLKISCIID